MCVYFNMPIYMHIYIWLNSKATNINTILLLGRTRATCPRTSWAPRASSPSCCGTMRTSMACSSAIHISKAEDPNKMWARSLDCHHLCLVLAGRLEDAQRLGQLLAPWLQPLCYLAVGCMGGVYTLSSMECRHGLHYNFQ